MRIRLRSRLRHPASRSHPGSGRLLFLGFLALVWFGAVLARLVHLQVVQHTELARRAERQQQRSFEVTPKRGVLYDRNGRELAVSIAVDSLFAVPTEVRDPPLAARQLAPLLEMEAMEVEDRLRSRRSFVWLKRKLDARSAQRVRELEIAGVYLQREHKRFYPKRELAAHVLGFVGVDENGLAGIEYSLDSVIRGGTRRLRITADGRRQGFDRQPVSEAGGRLPSSPEGASVVLSLDENIQYIAERELAAALSRTRARAGTVLVQDPESGEILALANHPTFNPNYPSRVPVSWHLNRALSLVYEPGSTFKVVTVAAALEEGRARPTEIIDCQNGAIVLAGHRIRDHKPFGLLSVRQVISESSDVGAIKLGLRLGNQKLYEHIRRWRFGQPTGIELPAESRGLLRPVTSWSRISLGAISMGQEVALTPLQLTVALSAIANGGRWVPPRLVREILRDRQAEKVSPPPWERILSSEVAEELQRMLTEVVRQGTGQLAQPQGYSAGGKTGTAQKIDESGTYSRRDFIASFTGFAPVRHPRITVTVVLDSPQGPLYHGGEVAAPVFRAVVEQTLAYLNVPHDRPLERSSRTPRLERAAVQDFQPGQLDPAASYPSVEGDLSLPEEASGLRFATLRRGAHQPPRSSEGDGARPARRGSHSSALRVSSLALSQGEMVEVPNFVGQSLRAVVAECARLGIEPAVVGQGLVAEQQPPPGSRVPSGSRVWLELQPTLPAVPVRPL